MITIINALIPGSEELQQIEITGSEIAAIKPMREGVAKKEKPSIIDVEGDWISLGGIDLQINGCFGLAFPDLTLEDLPRLEKICDFLWTKGVDGFLPTLVTTAVRKFQRSLLVLEEFIAEQKQNNRTTAQVLGVHLEGPFLNYEKRGAHPAEYLLTASLEALEGIITNHESIIKIMTLAPELDVTGQVINYLHSRGIIVSLGHSQATAKEARQAFEKGASMVTHAFNAMPSLHHRQPGLLGEAIVSKNVYCGVIADGHHVAPTMLKILLRACEYERGAFLVSDALAPLGLPDGIYPWDERKIQIEKGTARLASGKLAGTTLPLLTGVENLVKWDICKVESAIALATESPRKAIGLPGLSVGQKANLLRWNWQQELNKLTWQRLDLGWMHTDD
ncbi:N-acetylglucosamine-6-phosphate deacetylase [Gloeothece verrucosa]|uniref:N-acetylglucosamine-6-phosphate deacetylase n=1 Tax=Gloeothece verrucosa (strain PCC 7822) TaxID=497965 RepID=E0UAW2_GLOV7|nr:N-acetylglucosamine-6-phosphate deacetylase [Gloeothece verrucosa]ADN15084.1 N-acetylglucosamine-6-phosphate deacetylase [Gloeothece verrucosa PCC 7822]